MKNRSRYDLAQNVLIACEHGCRMNRILHLSMMSYSQYKEYIKWLTDLGMIVKKGYAFYITERGTKFLQLMRELDEMMIVG